MRIAKRLLMPLVLFLIVQASFVVGQEEVQPGEVGYDGLVRVGEQIENWRSLRDDVYLHAEHRQKIVDSTQPLIGAKVAFTARVERVTTKEVFVKIPDAQKTRIALRHSEHPQFGNLRSVGYGGPRSARIANILSKECSLRIGTEIEFEQAKQLRNGDVLEMRGGVETIHLLLEDFVPRAIVVIGTFEVTGMKPDKRRVRD